MKHTLITLLGLFFLTAGCSQNAPKTYSIKGTFDKSIQADSIFIYSYKDLIASAPLVNGAFELTGSVPQAELVDLYTRVKGEDPDTGTKAGRLILENANYTYSRKGEHIKINGGELHDLVLGSENSDEYQKAIDEYEALLDAVYAKKDGAAVSIDEEEQVRKMGNHVKDFEEGKLISIVKSDESPVLAKAFALRMIKDWDAYSLDERLMLFDTYLAEAKEGHEVIHKLRSVYAEMKEAEEMEKTVGVGQPFKEIEAKDIDGNVIKLSEIVAKNKYTILEFWASWCGPCRAEIPNLKKAYEKYKAKGLEIYSISIDEKQGKWLKALKEENTTWINVVENLGRKGRPTQDYGVDGIPASFLIDQAGKIVATSEELRGSDLDKTLSKFIK